MTNEVPNVSPTGRYNITEAATHLGVCRLTINRWVKQGKIKTKLRKTTLHPYITGTEILRVWNT